MRKRLAALLLAALGTATPAAADWQRARTAHFVLTIDDTPERTKDFATRLERFDAALRRLYNVPDDADRRVRPIAIYALRPGLFADACRCPGILGFYRPVAAGSFILALHDPAENRANKVGKLGSQTLLLHEYSHHFAFSSFPIAYPHWFSEGFAEFNANTVFKDDGAVVIGYAANYRANSLLFGGKLSARQMFEPDRYGYSVSGDLVYGRGWLLTHYLILDPHRRGQLPKFLAAMNGGKHGYDAAEAAFGDLSVLLHELDDYARHPLAPPLRVPPTGTVEVSVAPVGAGEAAMLPVYLRALNGVARYARPAVARSAEGVAASFPDDAVVQTRLADVEFATGRLDKADEAADRALRLQPTLVAALDRKGAIGLRRTVDSKGTDTAAASAARGWFLKANHADASDAAALFGYHASFVAAKAKPTPGAVKALMRAEVIAPESNDIRAALARQMLVDGDAAAARELLQPIAFAPHSRQDANIPRQAIELIDAGKPDEAKALLLKEPDKPDKDD